VNGLDIIEDGFPHGTIEGHRLGCKTGACPGKASELGDSCRQANIRYHGDWEYRKAVDAGLPLPPMVRDKPKGSKLKAATSSIIVEPTIDVASTVAPLPAEKPKLAPKAEPVKKVRATWQHGTAWGFQKGCKVDAECPAAIAGGQSCGDVARAYWRDQQAKKRLDRGSKPRKRKYRTVLERIEAAVGTKAPIETHTAADGTLVVTVRVPAVQP
jgi:hypothetical protein